MQRRKRFLFIGGDEIREGFVEEMVLRSFQSLNSNKPKCPSCPGTLLGRRTKIIDKFKAVRGARINV
jgi:hypothetical protein